MSVSTSTASIDEKNPSDKIIKLKSIVKELSANDVKVLLSSEDVKDKKLLNLIIQNVVEEGNIKAFKLLFDCGYKVDVISKNGQTPLHIAFYNCSSYKIEKRLVNLIFNCTGDKNFKDSMGLTHLHIACVFGNTDMVKKFIKNKEDLNACFRYQLTPLHFAVMYHRLDIVRLLVINGAKVGVIDHIGRTPLHLAARVIDDVQKSYLQSDDLEILKFLLDHQFNIQMKDSNGNTPISSIFQHFYANHEENLIWYYSSDDESLDDSKDNGIADITTRQREKLTILLKAGANITGANKAGDTILHHIITTTAYMRKPSDLCKVSFDDTQQVEMVKQILEVPQNLDINAKNQNEETPLQVTVSCLSSKVVEVLLKHKAGMSSLRFDYFHYVMVPNFECVQNLIRITELLSENGFEMTILHELPILKFLVHNCEDCNCTNLEQYFDIKDYLEILLHYGSPEHIKDVFKKIFKKSIIHSTHQMEALLLDVMRYFYYMKHGEFHIDEKVYDAIVKTLKKAKIGLAPFVFIDKEIEKMKVTELKSKVTLYEIMQKNPIHVYKYIEHKDFSFIEKDFPDLQDIIKGHLTKALIRNYVEKTTLDYLIALLPYQLDNCYETIMKYLSNEDLVNIVTVIFDDILEMSQNQDY